MGSLDEDCSVGSWQHVGPRGERSDGSFLESSPVHAAKGWEVARHQPEVTSSSAGLKGLPEGAGS